MRNVRAGGWSLYNNNNKNFSFLQNRFYCHIIIIIIIIRDLTLNRFKFAKHY